MTKCFGQVLVDSDSKEEDMTFTNETETDIVTVSPHTMVHNEHMVLRMLELKNIA